MAEFFMSITFTTIASYNRYYILYVCILGNTRNNGGTCTREIIKIMPYKFS